ncbi:MAG: type IV pilin-like G/H family protein [Cyanobacteria bacterium J06623_4]
MKHPQKARLIQSLTRLSPVQQRPTHQSPQRKSSISLYEGFTLIELMVVIVIVGMLSAIALPSFLNQANKAKQSEAKTYVGAMNRAQQAHFLERNKFAGRLSDLGVGINSVTQTYSYGMTLATGAAVGDGVTNYARPQAIEQSVKAYIGGVKLGSVPGVNAATTLAVLCEGLIAGNADGTEEADQLDTSIVGPPICPTTVGAAYRAVK